MVSAVVSTLQMFVMDASSVPELIASKRGRRQTALFQPYVQGISFPRKPWSSCSDRVVSAPGMLS